MAQTTVGDIMSSEPITITPDATVTEAARTMVENRVGALPVVEGERLVGIVTEGDLIMQDVKLEFPTYVHLLDGLIMYPPATARFENELRKAVAADVRAVMTTDLITIAASASVEDAATLLVDRDVSHLPVVEGDILIGILSKSDVVRSLLIEE